MDNHPIVFYDGVCGLCDRSIQFVIQRDRKRVFRYAALQSDIAREVLGAPVPFDSFVLYEQGKVYYRSTAALRVMRNLGGWWVLCYGLMVVPAFIRNGVYDLIARNRYRWFGKFDSCKIPSPEQRSLFID